MKRIKEIDGLRGIAILMVVMFHYLNNQLINSTNTVGKVLAKLTQFGWVGVDLFFVLSGFLIGSILLTNKQSPNYFKTFYIRRIVRIIPNYYLLLLLFAFVLGIGWFNNNEHLVGQNIIPVWSYWAFCQNFFMAYNNHMGNPPMVITWSIAIEEQFYIIFPLILYKLKNRFVPLLLLLLVLTALFFRYYFIGWIPRYVLLISRVDSLAIGILIAWLLLNYDFFSFTNKFKKHLIATLIILFSVCGILYLSYGDLGIFKHTFFALIFAILIIFALQKDNSWWCIFLRSNWLVWIGTISYSLYLFHEYVIAIIYHLFGRRGVMIQTVTDAGITFLSFAAALLVSYCIFRFLETPMIRIGKKYTY